ncbi:hypothetical protein E8E13_000294 [Curvularia kusanoi]|uniref:Uncharacterized protein n=1 Tax=Curvularia kusanoi TaxID=90978 RepID=A0A9P4T4R0_CURKU|nr:hypothetical protein E8E13_000294 [Curvularia kusanoi]
MDHLLLPLGAAFVLSSLVLFLLQSDRRDVILERFHLKKRRASTSRTPPRSLSPEKRRRTQSVSEVADYTTTLPPSRRFALAEAGLQTTYEEASPNRMLPLRTSYTEAADDCHTPCGFSVAEIKALGDFPDYAALSGVPLPAPYTNFDIQKAQPRPYRPFRWAYHQTMSLQKMEPDWWLELENTYVERLKERAQLLAIHGKAVQQALPGSELACKELMEISLQFLCARYPQYFSLNATKTVFYNAILKTETDLKQTPPLQVLFQHIPEDFVIMLRDEKTGNYICSAGNICSAIGWNIGTKIGLGLDEIHTPVPDYKEKMQYSMNRYFAKKPTDKPIQRGSYNIEVDKPLFVLPGGEEASDRSHQRPDLTVDRCHLRVDWQTLRRLPLSGGVVFNFKALFTPVTEFRDEPYVPALVLKILNEGKKNLMDYKKSWQIEHVVKPAMEAYHKEQVEKGLVVSDWEPHTLEESPYFRGWEEKWHRQQGF